MNNFPEFTSGTFNDYITHTNLIQIRPTISQVCPIRENMAVHYMYDAKYVPSAKIWQCIICMI